MKCDRGAASKSRDRIFIQSFARSEISEIQASDWTKVIMLNRLEYQPAPEQFAVDRDSSVICMNQDIKDRI